MPSPSPACSRPSLEFFQPCQQPPRGRCAGSSAAPQPAPTAALQALGAKREPKSRWVEYRGGHRSSGPARLRNPRRDLPRCPAAARAGRGGTRAAPSAAPRHLPARSRPYQRLQAVGELQQGAGDTAEAFLHGGREALPHPAAGQRAVSRAGGQRDAGPLGARLGHGGRRHGATAPPRRAAWYSPGTWDTPCRARRRRAAPCPPPSRPATTGGAWGRPPSPGESGRGRGGRASAAISCVPVGAACARAASSLSAISAAARPARRIAGGAPAGRSWAGPRQPTKRSGTSARSPSARPVCQAAVTRAGSPVWGTVARDAHA